MSKAYHHNHHYPVASTSYHQPPATASAIGSHRIRTAVERRHAAASAQPDFSHDIYIPESQEELSRVNIESRLLQPSGPSHDPNMRNADLTSASSTFDTYDRIGRDDDVPSTRPTAAAASRPSRVSNGPVTAAERLYQLDADESLIPGVGRGVRSTMPSQTSYQERLRSLNDHAAHNRYGSSPSKSPYRPGKYAHVGAPARQPVAAASTARPATYQPRVGVVPRQAQVESESESEGDSASESAESDAINVRTATFNSTGNHRNFAATPAGHTATITANLRQRPTLGQDTLDRIEFDIYTDTDGGEHRPRRDAKQPSRPRPDPTGPFASPRAANTFGMNAADYQQHLASRTLTSPALRTLIGDRSKSPDSPTPAPSIDGILHAGRTHARETQRQDRHQQPRAMRRSSVSAVSAFEDLARRLQKDVESTRRNADGNGEDVDDGSASNSGGSGFGPGSQASSARTRVEPEAAPTAASKAFNAAQFNSYGYPAHQKLSTGNDATSPWGVRLPDVTGLTSALGSPVKARDTVKHRPFDSAVGNQEARLEELVNLRCFVDGIQVELDRAGERILNLEQAQEQQSHEFQGLRSEMQTALKHVRAQPQPASDEQLVQLLWQKLSLANTQPSQQKQPAQTRPEAAIDSQAQPESEALSRETEKAPRESSSAQQQESRSQVEVVNRLYAELDQLRMAMEEQYRSAAAFGSSDVETQRQADAAPRRAAYKHQDNFPSGRDPWDAIEALRLQVLSLANEVEGLNGLVLEHLVQPAMVNRKRNARSSAARQQRFEFEQEAHPASDPIYTVRGAWGRGSTLHGERVDIRTDPMDADLDDHYRRPRQRTSPAHPASEDEYDQTIDAVAENLRVQRSRQQQRRRPNLTTTTTTVEDELSDNEISQLAEARALRAAARLSPARQTHDPHVCTVCSAQHRSEKRKASRRARLLQAEERRQAVELEESVLLSHLDSPRAHMRDEQLSTLRAILQEHWDEFLHQRMLYAELADELKSLSPEMSQTKRRILAQHVLEAVELLEVKADRIERLERLLQGTRSGRERDEGVEEHDKRKHAGSRQASANSAAGAAAGGGGGNRLKHAMESFERSSSGRHVAGGRNSPPTTIQL